MDHSFLVPLFSAHCDELLQEMPRLQRRLANAAEYTRVERQMWNLLKPQSEELERSRKYQAEAFAETDDKAKAMYQERQAVVDAALLALKQRQEQPDFLALEQRVAAVRRDYYDCTKNKRLLDLLRARLPVLLMCAGRDEEALTFGAQYPEGWRLWSTDAITSEEMDIFGPAERIFVRHNSHADGYSAVYRLSETTWALLEMWSNGLGLRLWAGEPEDIRRVLYLSGLHLLGIGMSDPDDNSEEAERARLYWKETGLEECLLPLPPNEDNPRYRVDVAEHRVGLYLSQFGLTRSGYLTHCPQAVCLLQNPALFGPEDTFPRTWLQGAVERAPDPAAMDWIAIIQEGEDWLQKNIGPRPVK